MPEVVAQFQMPMLKKWVPTWLGLVLYMITVLCVQFSAGVYLGALEAIRGTTGLMLEDMVYLLYACLAGMAVMFPMLFRMKFRFTNQQLLCGAAATIGLCNYITMSTDNMVILVPVCFLSGMAKLQGTFEVMSNIQLWRNPQRDMGIFFPFLHIFLLTAITGSAWLASVFAFHFTWQTMHAFTIGTMCVVILIQLIFCRPFCPMPQRIPLRGFDFLSAALICIEMLLATYIFVYGDHLMWFRSQRIRIIFGLALILLAVILYRLKYVDKPFISLQVFKYKNVIPILIVCLIGELLLSAEHSLEEIFYSEVVCLEEHTKCAQMLWGILGSYIGIVISFCWFKNKNLTVWRLFGICFACIFVYALLMYTQIDINAPIEQYRAAIIFRGVATAIIGIGLMWSLHESVNDFEHFFMALCVFNIMHMYLGGAQGFGLYTTFFKQLLADNMSRYGTDLTLSNLSTFGNHLAQTSSSNFSMADFVKSMMTISIKQIYGAVAWGAAFMSLAFFTLHIPRVRTGLNKIPYWPVLGIKMLYKWSQPKH